MFFFFVLMRIEWNGWERVRGVSCVCARHTGISSNENIEFDFRFRAWHTTATRVHFRFIHFIIPHNAIFVKKAQHTRPVELIANRHEIIDCAMTFCAVPESIITRAHAFAWECTHDDSCTYRRPKHWPSSSRVCEMIKIDLHSGRSETFEEWKQYIFKRHRTDGDDDTGMRLITQLPLQTGGSMKRWTANEKGSVILSIQPPHRYCNSCILAAVSLLLLLLARSTHFSFAAHSEIAMRTQKSHTLFWCMRCG